MTSRAASDDLGLAPRAEDRLLVDSWSYLPDRDAEGEKLAAGLRAGEAVVVVDITYDTPVCHRLLPEQVMKLEARRLYAETVFEELPRPYVLFGRKIGAL